LHSVVQVTKTIRAFRFSLTEQIPALQLEVILCKRIHVSSYFFQLWVFEARSCQPNCLSDSQIVPLSNSPLFRKGQVICAWLRRFLLPKMPSISSALFLTGRDSFEHFRLGSPSHVIIFAKVDFQHKRMRRSYTASFSYGLVMLNQLRRL
jgi:hypothetical protein